MLHRQRFLRGIGATTTAAVVPVGTALADDEDDSAGLRVTHASPDAPAVDVYVDGSKVVGELLFRSVTDYLSVPTGEREVAVNVAGEETTVFGPATLDLDAEDYTAVARGEVSDDDTTFTVDLFEDRNGANLGDEAFGLVVIEDATAPPRGDANEDENGDDERNPSDDEDGDDQDEGRGRGPSDDEGEDDD